MSRQSFDKSGLRSSTRRRRPGLYAEDTLRDIHMDKPAFLLPDAVFDRTLASHCAFPSLDFTAQLDHLGPSEAYKINHKQRLHEGRRLVEGKAIDYHNKYCLLTHGRPACNLHGQRHGRRLAA
jgi:hypothetical protein